jgi:hypothetical protein
MIKKKLFCSILYGHSWRYVSLPAGIRIVCFGFNIRQHSNGTDGRRERYTLAQGSRMADDI